MAGKSKALTRKISRKRALSYDRMAPNRRGVTALSEVNGKGSYARRYNATRRFLEGNDGMKRSGKRRAMKPNLRRGGQTVKKTDFIQEQIGKGASKKQAEARWKFARGRQGYKTTRKTKPKSYAGARALKARIGRGPGKKTVQTYAFRDKRTGRVRKIPDYKLLGYKSAQAMRQVYRTGSEEERARLGARMQRLLERREKASRTAAKRALEGRSLFSPNAGDGVLSFEEWSKMKKNAKKKTTARRKSTKKKTTTRKKKVGFVAMSPAKRKAIARKGGKAAAAKKAGKKTARKTSTKRKATRKATAKRASRKTTTRKRRQTAKQRRASIRNLKKGCTTVRKMKANRKGAYAANRKRRRTTRKGGVARRTARRRSSYRRNASGAMFKVELKNAFKFGMFVTGGLLVHRVVSNLLAEHAFSKIQAVEDSGYKGLISSIVTAGIGIPLAVRALPKHAGVFAAGMGASVIVELVKLVASKLDQPAILQAVSAYPDAPGYAQYSGLGAYYQYKPHQVFSGMGSYYETQPIPGLEQAAAGVGYGNDLPQLQQMYANPMGEYIAMGTEGIGEYEAAPTTPSFGQVDNGIAPNLNAAENALSVAEAAAGIGGFGSAPAMLTQAAAGYGGFGDLPLQSTVDPTIQAIDIPDDPGGSRAGILSGGDGIFG